MQFQTRSFLNHTWWQITLFWTWTWTAYNICLFCRKPLLEKHTFLTGIKLKYLFKTLEQENSEPVFVNVSGAQESIPRNWPARLCTVTRLDAIFLYPDRVPLTHSVHRAKKVFRMCGPEFSVEFSAPPEFCIWEQGGRKPMTFRLGSRYSTTASLHPCVQLPMTFIVFLAGIFQPFL